MPYKPGSEGLKRSQRKYSSSAKGKATRAKSFAKYRLSPEYAAARRRAQKKTPTAKHRAQMMLQVAKKHVGPQNVTVSVEQVRTLILAAVAEGYVTLERHRPDTASLDQTIPGAGYHLSNIKVVPWWYNRAKFRWSEQTVIDAVKKFYPLLLKGFS